MRSVLAGLRTLVLPWGATTGRRIVLAGDQAAITLYDGTTIVGEIKATGSPFDLAMRLAVAGDTDARWYVRPDGAMFWGPGNIGADTMIERIAPALLHTPGSLLLDGDLDVGVDLLVGGTATVNALDVATTADVAGDVTAGGLVVPAGSIESPAGRRGMVLVAYQQVDATAGGLALAVPPAVLVPGMTVNLTSVGANALAEITATVSFRNTTFTATTAMQAELRVNGVAFGSGIVAQPSASPDRRSVTRTWLVPLVVAGAYSFQVFASSTTGAANYSVEGLLSTLVGKLFE